MARRLRIELDLDAKGFGATISDASGKITAFSGATDRAAAATERMERRMRGVLATARDLTLVLSQVRVAIYNLRVVMTGWVEKIVQANIEVERMTFLLAGMSDKLTFEGRMEEAAGQVDMLLQKAKQAPFTISAMTDSLVKMKAGGLDPLDGSLNSLIDSVAAFGGDDQMLKRASIAIQQMGGKGVISMEELRQQLGEAVPFAMQLMSRSMGLTMKEMVDAISEGSVEAETALNGMFGEFERTFGGSAARLMDTFTGRLNVARTSLTEFGLAVGGFSQGSFADGGFMSTLNEKLEEFIALLATPEAQIFAKRVGEALVGIINGLETAIKIVVQFRDVIIFAGKALATYFGVRVIGATLGGLVTGLGAARTSLVTFGAALTQTGSVLGMMGSDMVRVTGQAGAMRARVGTLTAGVGLLRGAVGALLGPLGFFVTAAIMAADALGFFRNKTKEAEQAVEDFKKGLASEDGISLMVEQSETLSDELERVISRLEEMERLENAGRFIQPEYLQFLRDEFRRLTGEISETDATIRQMRESLNQNAEEAAAAKAIRELARESTDLTRAYGETRQELAKILQAIVDNENLTEEEAAAQRKAIRNQEREETIAFYRDKQAIAEAYQARIDAQINNASALGIDPQTVAELRAQSAAVGEEITDLIDRGVRATQVFDKATETFSEFAGSNEEAADKLAPFTSKLESLKQRAAGLGAQQDQLSGSVSAVGKEYAQALVWIDGFTEELSGEQRKALLDAAANVDNLTESVKTMRRDASLMGRLESQFQRASEYAEQMALVLNKGLSETEAEAAMFELRLQQIVDQIELAGEKAVEFKNKATQAFTEGRTNEFLIGLRRQTEQIKADLLDRDEAAEANFQRDIDRIWEQVNTSELAGQARINAEKIVNDYISARRQQLEEETKGQMQRTMEKWAKTTENMEGAAVGWMDSFVDALVEGELSFGKFAKAILADIAKIIIRAQIANAIMSAFGGGGGGGFTFKQNGGNTIGKVAHTGGIMGVHSKGSRSLPSAIFGGAPRYHNGGIAGLRPNEVPAILERGERVLTEAEQRAMEGGGRTPTVEVNIVNQGGQQMQEESRSSRFDGEKWVVDIVTRHMSQPGKLRNTTKQLARS